MKFGLIDLQQDQLGVHMAHLTIYSKYLQRVSLLHYKLSYIDSILKIVLILPRNHGKWIKNYGYQNLVRDDYRQVAIEHSCRLGK